jgi:hypothetical protein
MYAAMASVLLTWTLAWGQQPQTNGRESSGPSLLVRMSFANSFVRWGYDSLPQICFSIDRSGHYEMRRLTMKGGAPYLQGTPHPELLQGTLPSVELGKLEKLLGDPEFVKLTDAPASILLKGAETFVAEVPRDTGVQRVVMSDADGQNPFPHSVRRIVSWLQQFKDEGAEPLDVSAPDICPSRTLQPVHPNIAALQPAPSSGACTTR